MTLLALLAGAIATQRAMGGIELVSITFMPRRTSGLRGGGGGNDFAVEKDDTGSQREVAPHITNVSSTNIVAETRELETVPDLDLAGQVARMKHDNVELERRLRRYEQKSETSVDADPSPLDAPSETVGRAAEELGITWQRRRQQHQPGRETAAAATVAATGPMRNDDTINTAETADTPAYALLSSSSFEGGVAAKPACAGMAMSLYAHSSFGKGGRVSLGCSSKRLFSHACFSPRSVALAPGHVVALYSSEGYAGERTTLASSVADLSEFALPSALAFVGGNLTRSTEPGSGPGAEVGGVGIVVRSVLVCEGVVDEEDCVPGSAAALPLCEEEQAGERLSQAAALSKTDAARFGYLGKGIKARKFRPLVGRGVTRAKVGQSRCTRQDESALRPVPVPSLKKGNLLERFEPRFKTGCYLPRECSLTPLDLRVHTRRTFTRSPLQRLLYTARRSRTACCSSRWGRSCGKRLAFTRR